MYEEAKALYMEGIEQRASDKKTTLARVRAAVIDAAYDGKDGVRLSIYPHTTVPLKVRATDVAEFVHPLKCEFTFGNDPTVFDVWISGWAD